MSGSIWETLGIAATRDRGDIRRAYAAQLKLHQPEDDPDGFQRLRFAYERALAYAQGSSRRAAPPSIKPRPTPKPTTPAPEAVTPPPDAPPPRRARARKIAGASPDAAPLPPPPPPDTAKARLATEEEQAHAEHEALCNALQRLVATRADAEEMAPALAAVLNARAMESVGVHGRTEQWLAHLIAHNAPASDSLVGPAIAHFGWKPNRLGRPDNSTLAVLQRSDDLAFLLGFRRPTHPSNPALRALSRPPVGFALLSHRVTPLRANEVRELLMLIRRERRSILGDLNPEAVSWWDAYLARPQFSAGAIWSAILAPPVLALLAMASGWLGPQPALAYLAGYVISLTVVLGGSAAVLYGVARPRARWLSQWRYSAPLWLRLGWAPAAVGLLLACAAPPSLWVTPLLGAAALAVVYWALMTGELDRRNDVGTPWRATLYWNPIWLVVSLLVSVVRPGIRYPWQMRALCGFLYLGYFTLGPMDVALPGPAWLQLGLGVGVAGFAFTWGAASLHEYWIGGFSSRARVWSLIGLIVATVVAVGGLVLACVEPSARPAAAALVAALVVVHKTVAYDLRGTPYLIRDLMMRIGWIGWLIVLGAFGFLATVVERTELSGGLWLLGGVTAAVFAALWQISQKPRAGAARRY